MATVVKFEQDKRRLVAGFSADNVSAEAATLETLGYKPMGSVQYSQNAREWYQWWAREVERVGAEKSRDIRIA